MEPETPTFVVCSCEGTMAPDAEKLASACGAAVRTADQLCRRQLDLFRAIVGAGGPVVVGCTQEAPRFAAEAAALGAGERVRFANLRETAGWSDDAAAAGAKMAALLAAAAEPAPQTPHLTLTSGGAALVYGRDERALEAAQTLAGRLDVTLLLAEPADVTPPRVVSFPIFAGRIRGLTGHLGDFAATVEGLAQAAPSSRRALAFGPTQDGAVLRCDLVVDLSGGAPLVAADDLRAGYLRADPGDGRRVARTLLAAADLVGEFDKPRFIDFTDSLCAHSRSRITGCTRCLDVCPAGAIAPAGDHVAIDAFACAGCGGCAAVCPTGAAAYALPPVDAMLGRLRTLLTVYRAAGGRLPVVLVHDGDHGEATIDALARHGAGLPATVLPFRVNETTQIGLETIAAAFAWGASGFRILTRARPRHDPAGLRRTIALAQPILAALGFGAGAVGTIETDDPDALRAALDAAPAGTPSAAPSTFLPAGAKRGVLEFALGELHRAAPTPVDVVDLPAGAPFGGLEVRVDGCTLCLACVGACPTSALGDDPELPTLRFSESRCVQCGLCAATCPEKVITLAPKLDFAAWRERERVIKREEPFACTTCGKKFGTKGAVERVRAKLAAGHWMFSGANAHRAALLTMCEGCRADRVMNDGFDPYAAGERPRPRTTEDYLRERAAGKDDLPDA